MRQITLYSLVIDCGDGSAYAKMFDTKEQAEAHGDADFERSGEGYGSQCIDKHIIDIDDYLNADELQVLP